MINQFGDDIRFTDRYRTKYGSAMAEWLDSGPEPDESTGSVEWRGHVARFGKRLMIEDDQGFVTVERFGSETAAIYRFEQIDAEYSAWMDDDEPADEPAIICHDGSTVDLSLGVPACLQATPIPGSRFNDWVTAHNRALDDYRHNRARRNETAVLSLAEGILQFCSSHDAMGTGDDTDWYGAEHVLVPLLDGFDNALNFDLGRLDGGTLSGFSHAVRNAYAGGMGA
jgi:hypothetical protein